MNFSMPRFRGIQISLVVLSTLILGSVSQAGTYLDIVASMDVIQAANPELISKFDLATNDQGQKIFGWRFENLSNLANLGGKSKLLVVGAHHGNELQSADVSVQIARDLVAQMTSTQAAYYAGLSNRVLFVIPVLNIGGYNATRREEATKAGVLTDPNRDYPDPCGNSATFKLSSTKALADFMKSEEIAGAITIHGYVGSFTYPWGTYTDHTHTLDQDFFEQIAKVAVAQNGYETGTHADVIYPTVGAFEDWAYHELGSWTMLMELRKGASLAKDSRAALAYFAQVPEVRSFNNEHTGHCRKDKGIVRGRP